MRRKGSRAERERRKLRLLTRERKSRARPWRLRRHAPEHGGAWPSRAMVVPRLFAPTGVKPRQRRDARDVGGDESPRNSTVDEQRRRGHDEEAAKRRSARTNRCAVVRPFDCVRSRRRGRPVAVGIIRRRRGDHGVARERERLGFLREERGENEWADRAQRVARVRPNPLGHPDRWGPRAFRSFPNSKKYRNFEIL
jgi:hypothetical protein